MHNSLSRINVEVAVIGLGAFGLLAARELSPYVNLIAYDPDANRCRAAKEFGRIARIEECARASIVILAVPFPQLMNVAEQISNHLRPGALVADVCSVKMKPLKILERALPGYVRILGTHPLFGPESAADGLQGHTIVLCPHTAGRARIVRWFLERRLGLKVEEREAAVHDREMATIQGLTHFIARILRDAPEADTALATKSFLLLQESAKMVAGDSDILFKTIESENPYSRSVRASFVQTATEIDRDLHQDPEFELVVSARSRA